MSESKDLERLYIAVDSSRIIRCKWCGIPESENWIHVQDGVYCSDACLQAGSPDMTQLALFCCLVNIIMIMILTREIVFAGWSFPLLFIGILVFLLLFVILDSIKEPKQKIPKGSRYDELSSELAILRTMSSVGCPKCGGNLDLSDIADDKIYECNYCGFTGVIELMIGNE